jgi:hypothetical protein
MPVDGARRERARRFPSRHTPDLDRTIHLSDQAVDPPGSDLDIWVEYALVKPIRTGRATTRPSAITTQLAWLRTRTKSATPQALLVAD